MMARKPAITGGKPRSNPGPHSSEVYGKTTARAAKKRQRRSIEPLAEKRERLDRITA